MCLELRKNYKLCVKTYKNFKVKNYKLCVESYFSEIFSFLVLRFCIKGASTFEYPYNITKFWLDAKLVYAFSLYFWLAHDALFPVHFTVFFIFFLYAAAVNPKLQCIKKIKWKSSNSQLQLIVSSSLELRDN